MERYRIVETRWSTGNMLTDKLFTGQREMAGLGIYHYGARFYSPKLGRFLSADTIVPGYANPQNLNRYAYVLNNPVRYNDPTGHYVDDNSKRKAWKYSTGYKINTWKLRIKIKFGITLSGEWNEQNAQAANSAAQGISTKLGGIENFRSEFNTNNTPLILLWGNSSSEYYISSECKGISSGACNTGRTQDVHGNPVTLINFMSMCCYLASVRNNVVHEVGHLFNVLHGGNPASLAGNYAADRKDIWRPFDGTQWQFNKFYDPKSPGKTNSEMFADMFVAWVYDAWNTDPRNVPKVDKARNDMITNMAEWLK